MKKIEKILSKLSKEEILELINLLLGDYALLSLQNCDYKECVNKPYTKTKCNEKFVEGKCQLCILELFLESVKENLSMEEEN